MQYCRNSICCQCQPLKECQANCYVTPVISTATKYSGPQLSDYKTWGVFQQPVYETQADFKDLSNHLIDTLSVTMNRHYPHCD